MERQIIFLPIFSPKFVVKKKCQKIVLNSEFIWARKIKNTKS